MTFLEALYGSQYDEIAKNGKDGNKGRFNANLFLTAFVLISVTTLMLMLAFLVPKFGHEVGRSLKKVFGFFTGRAMGKIIAIVFGGLFYFVITKTVGTEERFRNYIECYAQYPEEIRNKATQKLLIPFFAALSLLVVFAFLVD